jgi:tryptophan 2,3-dioxygenase
MENPNGFMKHFMEEIKAQMGNAEQQQQKAMMDSARRTPPQPESTSKTLEDQHSAEAVWRLAQRNSVKHEAAQKRSGPKQSAPTQEDADAIWREAIRNGSPQAPKGSFMGEYMSALREQMRQNPKGK